MEKKFSDEIRSQYLLYDFTYEGILHRGKVKLDEDTSGLYLMYDDHDIEITWVKHIRHKGKYIELSIVVNDDAYEPEKEGKVVASAWVCVYSLSDRQRIIDQFEPEDWAYIDEMEPRNSVSKETFYTK